MRVAYRNPALGSGAATVKLTGPFGIGLAETRDIDIPELLPGARIVVTEQVTGTPTAAVAVVDLYVEGGPTLAGPVRRPAGPRPGARGPQRRRGAGAAPARVVVDVTAGRGRHPTGLVDVPELPPLAVGEEREYRVPVRLGAPTIGTYRVEGTVVPDAAEPMTFSATVTTQPWA